MLSSCQEFFERSTSCLQEGDSDFVPVAEMMTASQQIAHVARTVDWFVDGAFAAEGFDLDFEAHGAEVAKISSLEEARAWLGRAFENAKAVFGGKSPEELAQPIAAGPIMGGAPRFAVIGALQDHTAHHRGALGVYSRLRGYAPPMPYGDM